MNFPKYWALGKAGDFWAWRWSDNSMAEAQSLADKAAHDLAARFETDDGFRELRKHSGYYPNRPFREPILNEIRNTTGERAALVTRNSYGCHVLNTAKIMFVDIDLPEPKPPRRSFFQQLFGKAAPELPPPSPDPVIAKVESWTRARNGWGWRVYRTRAGLRLMATHDVFDPGAKASDATLEELGSDPLYRRLCLNQKCYRARLTPKPWRCDAGRPPVRWPFLTPKAEAKFGKWEKEYQDASTQVATCEFIKAIGNPRHHPDIQHILSLHDETTRATSKLKLA